MRKQFNDPRIKNRHYIDAWNNALQGIIYTAKTEVNFKVQLVIAVTVMILSLFFGLTTAEFLCLVFSVILVLFAELVNTAVEMLVDLYTDLYHPKAKLAKDIAAGAVVITAINGVIVAYFLFYKKLGETGTIVLETFRNSPVHMVFVALMLTIIGVISIKAITNKGTPLHGGMPSGHAALAFACITGIWLNTNNLIVFMLGLIMSILVAESRVDTKAHSWAEVIFGAFFGILITLMIYSLTIIKI